MGYWERPEETRKAVVDGWMHTGDGGYMDEDGYVYVVDRIKDMIISGGENVYSAEVENCIAQHPGRRAMRRHRHSRRRMGRDGACGSDAQARRRPVTADDIIAFCKERIAGYKCPRSVAMQDEPLPLSGAGKILKRELRKPYWEGQDARRSVEGVGRNVDDDVETSGAAQS